MKHLRVAVISGGASQEHDISRETGRALGKAVQALGHTLIPIVISRSGVWSALPIPRILARRASGVSGRLPPDASSLAGTQATALTIIAEPRRQSDAVVSSGHEPIPRARTATVDVVVNGLHGTYGEDGRIQALLDLLGVPYTGSGVLASSLAMDKARFKDFARGLGVAVTGGFTVTKGESRGAIQRRFKTLHGPVFVKPNSQGSSVGVSHCQTWQQVLPALHAVWRVDTQALIEPDLGRREYTIPVVGNHHAAALPVIAIEPTRDSFFSYAVKYDGSTKEICPAPISKALQGRLQRLAVKLHEALGARGVTRTDVIVSRGRPYVLEVNTLPGMTAESLVPKSAAAHGWTFPSFVQHLIDLALER